MNYVQKSNLAVLMAASLAACAPDAAEGVASGAAKAADEGGSEVGFTTQALASVDFGEGASLRFYEPVPGYIVTARVDALRSDVVPAAEKGETPVELYERASGDAAPDALLLAQERSDLRALASKEATGPSLQVADNDDELPAAPAATPPAPTSTKALVDDTWFFSNFCFTAEQAAAFGITDGKFSNARQVRGDRDFQINDVLTAEGAASNLDGPTFRASFKIRPYFTWSPAVFANLQRGQFITFSSPRVNPPNTDFDAKVAVTGASSSFYSACIDGQKGH